MKIFTLLVLAALVAPSAFAGKTAPGVSLPATAKLLFQTTGGSALAYATTEDAALQAAADSGRSNIQKITEEGDDTHGPINVEYQCQSVYRVWSPANLGQYTRGSAGGFFSTSGAGQTTYSASVTVNVYCDPREFQQKVSISAMQACEKEPKIECMSKDYMEAFSKIQKTTYFDIYKK